MRKNLAMCSLLLVLCFGLVACESNTYVGKKEWATNGEIGAQYTKFNGTTSLSFEVTQPTDLYITVEIEEGTLALVLCNADDKEKEDPYIDDMLVESSVYDGYLEEGTYTIYFTGSDHKGGYLIEGDGIVAK